MSWSALLKSCSLIDFAGEGFRYVPGKVVIEAKGTLDRFFAGTGAGRCNPPGVKRIYLGLEEPTAKAEFDHYQRLVGLEPDTVEIYRFALRIGVKGVVDLRDAAVVRHLALSADDLNAEYSSDPKRPTKLQALGAEIASGGRSKGLVLPSVRHLGGQNIVLFTDRLERGVDSLTTHTNPVIAFP